jgi:hypothetical protein
MKSPVVLVLLGLGLLAIFYFVRQEKRKREGHVIVHQERTRPLAITLLDPVITFVIVGPILRRLVTLSPAHTVVAIAGGVVGVVIAYWRAKVQFVRAIKPKKMVVLRRHALEYVLIIILILVRSGENAVAHKVGSAETLLYAAFVALGLIESIARTLFILGRYRADESLDSVL